MKILVTGSKGQLGTDCMAVLGASATGLDLPALDISSRRSCEETLDRLHPAVIVNCAAYTNVDACESDPACWKVNAEGPGFLAEWAAAHSARVIHISTDYVFDGQRPLFEAYCETDAPAPVSEYGRSKLAGEQAVIASGATYSILRTAWLYGLTGQNFLKTILRLALQNPEKEIRVVNDQFGSPTWSHTLARQVARIIETEAAGLFHAVAEGYCSRFDFAAFFLEMMGVPCKIVPCTTREYPTPAQRPVNSILENRALKQRGLSLFGTWQDELRRFTAAGRQRLMREAEAL